MSKVTAETLKKCIAEMLEKRKQRKFVETVELQVVLREYDLEKDTKFAGQVKLPNQITPQIKVCVLGNAVHNEEAQKAGIDFIDVDGLKAFNKEKAKIRRWAKQYDMLLGSEAIVKQVNKILGNVLIKMKRFPVSMNEGDKVVNKIEELKHTVRFQLKKSICLGTGVGTVKLNPEELRQNINMAINYLVSLLKKGWQNIRTLHIKTSMGPSQRIFG